MCRPPARAEADEGCADLICVGETGAHNAGPWRGGSSHADESKPATPRRPEITQGTYGWTAVAPKGSQLVATTDEGQITIAANAREVGRRAGEVRIAVHNAHGSWTNLTLSPDGDLLGFARGPRKKEVRAQLDAQDKAR